MRLIDADALKKVIENWIADIKCSDDDDANAEGQALFSVLCQIDDQPTAYNVEAVVEGVTDVAEILKKDLYVEAFCRPKVKSGECATMGCTKCLTDEIIRIVKAGGNK